MGQEQNSPKGKVVKTCSAHLTHAIFWNICCCPTLQTTVLRWLSAAHPTRQFQWHSLNGKARDFGLGHSPRLNSEEQQLYPETGQLNLGEYWQACLQHQEGIKAGKGVWVLPSLLLAHAGLEEF